MALLNGGRDAIASMVGDSSGSRSAPATFVGITADNAAVNVADTTLASEIATGGGGLIRKAFTYAHTGGAATYTLTGTYTANGSDVVPVTAKKAGVFTAVTSGTMVWEKIITDTPFTISGDAATLTATITLS